MEEEKSKILNKWREANSALQNKNWDIYSSIWAHTDYIQILHPDEGEWLKGWKLIGPAYRELIEDGPEIQSDFYDVNVRISKDNTMAWLTCKNNIRLINGDEIEFESWQTCVFEKIAGEWKMVHGHASNIEEN